MRNKKSPWVLLILLLAGIVVGGVIGDILSNYMELFKYNFALGMTTPWHIDFKAIEITLGFIFNINAGSILGIILAVLGYLKA